MCKDNANQIGYICVPIELKSIENRLLPAPSTITEDQKLQVPVSIYSPSQQVEESHETYVKVQDQSKEPGVFASVTRGRGFRSTLEHQSNTRSLHFKSTDC